MLVNFATKRARISGDIAPETIIGAVERLGYEAAPFQADVGTEGKSPEEERRVQELKVAFVLTVPVFALGMAHLEAAWSFWVQMVLTTIVLAWPGRGFYRTAAKLLVHGGVNMDTLVALGTGAAYGLSFVGHHAYFESAAVIAALVLLGQHLEANARHASAAAIRSLHGLQAKTARRVNKSGAEEDIDILFVQTDDVLSVRAGDKVPTDGVIVAGDSLFDESLVTGESMPAARRAGDPVVGATLNVGQGRVLMRVTAAPDSTVLARIVSLVEDAQASKAKVQRLADRVARVFVPAVLLLAIATFFYWWDIVPAIAVLVIACPCALGLATPTAILAGTGRAAQHMILIRSAPGLEATGAITTLVVDKTGTLTDGRPAVVEALYASPEQSARTLSLLASAEKVSQHPLAYALLAFAEKSDVSTAIPVTASAEVSGFGLEATVEEHVCLLGNRALLARHDVAIPAAWTAYEDADGRGLVYAAIDGAAAALFVVEDPLRASTVAAVQTLRRLGIDIIMATGDRAATARRIGAAAGIATVHAGLTPEGKLTLVQSLKGKGRVIGMVGDGVNDAPALAAADSGIALGSGADVALAAAHVVIPHGNLAKIAEAIYISRQTMRVVRQNLGWAFLYNVLAIPVAAAGGLSPMLAALAMAGSSVSVVTNSLRLRSARVPAGIS